MSKMKSLKSSITKPYVLLLIIFPLITILLFNVVIRIYIDRNTKNSLESLVQTANSALSKELPDASSGTTKQEIAAAFDKAVQELTAENLMNNSEIFLFDRNQELVYPQNQSSSFIGKRVSEKVLRQLINKPQKNARLFHMGPTNYYVVSGQIDSLKEQGYQIAYVAQADVLSPLLHTINLILLCILFAGAALAAFIASRLSSRISGRVAALCNFAGNIGRGEFSPPPPHTDDSKEIAELHMLYLSLSDMSAKLNAYDKAQKTFLQNASHELKTPLMSIQGYAEGISGGILPDVKHAADIIGGESKRLNTLVEELLTLSRIESQTYAKELVLCNLADMLKEYAQRLGGFAAKMNRTLTLDLPKEPVMVYADDVLLSQAVMNITSNCLRYAKTQARIALIRRGEFAAVRITDDGSGIAPEDLPHIFERFYKGKGGNFGLGLAIAKSAVEFMGGTVNAYNSDNGAVFEVRLSIHQ